MDLVVVQAGVHRGVVVEDLALAHGIECGIYAHRGADTDAVVDAFAHEAELEAEDEVAVFLDGVEVAGGAIAGRHVDCPVDGSVAFLVALPLVEVGAVEEDFKTLGGLVGGKDEYRRRLGVGEKAVDLVDGIAVVGTAAGSIDGLGLFEIFLVAGVVDFLVGLGRNRTHGSSRRIGGVAVEIFAGEEEGLHRGDLGDSTKSLAAEVGVIAAGKGVGDIDAALVKV